MFRDTVKKPARVEPSSLTLVLMLALILAVTLPSRAEEPKPTPPEAGKVYPADRARMSDKERGLARLRREIALCEKRIAALEEEAHTAQDPQLAAITATFKGLIRKQADIMRAELAAVEKDDADSVRTQVAARRELYPQVTSANRKYNVLKENENMRDLAAKAGDADSLALAEKAANANLAMLAIEEQLVELRSLMPKLEAEKRSTTAELESRQGAKPGEKGEVPETPGKTPSTAPPAPDK